MSDSTFQRDFSSEPATAGAAPPPEDAPQFGAVDIVEAFTALRHEWRGQTKETRTVAEQIQAAVSNLQSLESNLQALESKLDCIAESRPDNSQEAKRLVLSIVETDHQFTRAVAAISQWEAQERLRDAANAAAVEHHFATMNPLARWFARPLVQFLDQQRSASAPAAQPPAIEGLNMVLARLRRMMQEQDIERLDVLGQQFDGDTMHAIGTVACTDHPAGHVADQLSAAYRWQGKLIRFADVRVAN